jgi:RHS repeat-associated protein
VVRITYDNANRYASVQLRNGVTQAYAYDAAGQLTSITYRTATTTLGNLTYDYDALGRVIRQGGTLARVDLPAAVIGNTYNANNQLSMSGYSYDANGRMTSNGSSTFTWDARGQLAQIAGAVPAQFSYDGLGRRARKSINTVPTQFLYDGTNIIQELADGTSPGVNATYLTGFGMDETLGRTVGSTKADYLADRLGSTLALTDASANMSANYSYEPYGKSTKFSGSDQTALTFTAREDDSTGLVYLRARYLDPATGRFVSEDPLGLSSGDANLYSYVSANPINYSDPTGLHKRCLAFWPGAEHCDSNGNCWCPTYEDNNPFIGNPGGIIIPPFQRPWKPPEPGPTQCTLEQQPPPPDIPSQKPDCDLLFAQCIARGRSLLVCLAVKLICELGG